MKTTRHKLLVRQIQKDFPSLQGKLSISLLKRIETFFDKVSAAYQGFDEDRRLLERSMEISSNELFEANETLRKQAANLIASSKMSELGKMAGGIAHEINNPLAILHLSASQLQDLCEDGEIDPEKLKALSNTIQTTTERIAKIVSGLKTFSRDGSEDPFEDIELSTLVADTLNLCGEKFKLHKVQIFADVPTKLYVHCRGVQISQVLLNLLNNAFDAISQNHEKWVRITAKDVGSLVEISVIDSGKGIAEAHQEKLFFPFFTTKEIGKGTGLGLSICLGIIKGHGGTIFVDKMSSNTCFVVKLPKRPSALKEAS